MKSLTILLFALLMTGTVENPDVNNPSLKQQLDTELNFKKYVKIYSYEGDLIRQLAVDDVSDATITVIDYLVLESSDFAFEMYGDYYYFTEKRMIGDLIN